MSQPSDSLGQTFKLRKPLQLEMHPDGSFLVQGPFPDQPERFNENEIRLTYLLSQGLSVEQSLEIQGIADGPGMAELTSKLLSLGILEPRPSAPVTHPQKKLLIQSKQLGEVDSPSGEQLLREYVVPSRPVIINGLIEDWPARRLWTPEYFNRLLNASMEPETATTSENTNAKEYWISEDIVDESSELHDLLEQVKFPYSIRGLTQDVFRLWYGPPNAGLANIHFDEHHNFIANLYGHKHFLLVAPRHRALLRPFPWWTGFSWVANGRFLKPESDPSYRALPPDIEAYEYTLRPGQVLFLPSRWWHNVHAVDLNITLSMFWDIPRIFHRTRTYGAKRWVAAQYRKLFSLKLPTDIRT